MRAAASGDGSKEEVLAWGHCHHSDRKTSTPQPVAALAGRPVSQISIGAHCSIAVADDGQVLVAGRVYVPDQHSRRSRNWNADVLKGWWPLRYLAGIKISQVACGLFFNVFLSENGEVLTCGQGRCGALGHGDLSDRTEPYRVQELAEERVFLVAAGARHACALSFSGNFYSWGCGGGGRLGLGDERDRHCPQLHNEDTFGGPHPAAIACGFTHSLIVLDNGSVWSFGSGGRGQLGHGSKTNELYPRKIEYLDRERVVHVCGGAWHSLALTENGDVYSWGSSQYGELGNGSTEDCVVPQMVWGMGDSRVAHIAAGGVFSAAVTDGGAVYTWGCNNFGQLGREIATIFDATPGAVVGIHTVETLIVGPCGSISLCTRGSQWRQLSSNSSEEGGGDDEAARAAAEFGHVHTDRLASLRDPHSPMGHGVGGTATTVDEATEFEMLLFPERFE